MQDQLRRHSAHFLYSSIILVVAIFSLHFFQFTTEFLDSRAVPPIGARAFFIPNQLRPQPYKIPTFLITVGIVSLVITLAGKKIRLTIDSFSERQQKPVWPFFLFLFLSGYYVWLLGSYPMFEASQFTLGRSFVAVIFTLFWWGILFFAPKIFERCKKNIIVLETLAITILVLAATYMPTFPVEPYDYSYLIGPAFEVAAGKTIYTEAPSQYGFGYTFLFAAAEKIVPGILLSLPIYIWLLYVLEVTLLFLFVRKFSGSLRAGIVAVGASLTLSFFSLLSTPFGIPQVGAFRWLQFLLTFLILIFYEEKAKKREWVLLPVAVMAFLVVDVGLEISIGLCLYWGLRYISGNISLIIALRKCVIYVTALAATFLFLNVASHLFGGSSIDIALVLHTVRQYGVYGFGMLPLAQRTFYWLYFLTMISSFFIYAVSKKETTWSRAVLLSGIFLMAGSIYMMGRSHPHNIFNISRLWILNLCVLLTPLIKKAETLSSRQKNLFFGAGVFFLIFIPAVCRQQNMSHLLREKVGRVTALAPYVPHSVMTDFTVDFERDLRSYPQTYAQEIQMINETFPVPHTPMLLFALNSTFYHYISGHPSLIWSDPLNAIVQQSELDDAFTPLRKSGCPATILYDPRCIEHETCNRSPDEGVLNAQDKIFQGFIHLCGRYEPTRCTDRLCVGKRI